MWLLEYLENGKSSFPELKQSCCETRQTAAQQKILLNFSCKDIFSVFFSCSGPGSSEINAALL